MLNDNTDTDMTVTIPPPATQPPPDMQHHQEYVTMHKQAADSYNQNNPDGAKLHDTASKLHNKVLASLTAAKFQTPSSQQHAKFIVQAKEQANNANKMSYMLANAKLHYDKSQEHLKYAQLYPANSDMHNEAAKLHGEASNFYLAASESLHKAVNTLPSVPQTAHLNNVDTLLNQANERSQYITKQYAQYAQAQAAQMQAEQAAQYAQAQAAQPPAAQYAQPPAAQYAQPAPYICTDIDDKIINFTEIKNTILDFSEALSINRKITLKKAQVGTPPTPIDNIMATQTGTDISQSRDKYLDTLISGSALDPAKKKYFTFIKLLLTYMHDVVSAAYGCLHDFGDKHTARLIFDENIAIFNIKWDAICLLYTSPSPRD